MSDFAVLMSVETEERIGRRGGRVEAQMRREQEDAV